MSLIRNSSGFTYLAALMLVVIMGIMLGITGQYWSQVIKREKEEELIFRGLQYVQAIKRWRKPAPGHATVAVPLYSLEDLMRPRGFANVHYLRKLFKDPINDKDWVLVKDPQFGIIGVASSSQDTPIRQNNFLSLCNPGDDYLIKMFKTFEGKTKYSDWQFVYRP